MGRRPPGPLRVRGPRTRRRRRGRAFATVEAAGGFGLPRDVDRSYRFLIDTIIAGLQNVSVEPAEDASSREFHPTNG
jgi:hypothetical protein